VDRPAEREYVEDDDQAPRIPTTRPFLSPLPGVVADYPTHSHRYEVVFDISLGHRRSGYFSTFDEALRAVHGAFRDVWVNHRFVFAERVEINHITLHETWTERALVWHYNWTIASPLGELSLATASGYGNIRMIEHIDMETVYGWIRG
jgi:hypothetical protein